MSTPTAEPPKVPVARIVASAREAPVGPASEAELKWKRQKMTRWFSPSQLAATGVRALLSGVFGAYADRREVQAALHLMDPGDDPAEDGASADGLIFRYDERGDAKDGFWIDFVADLGDGFDSTYTVAWLLAQPTLPRPRAGDAAAPVRREERARSLLDGATPPERTRRGHVLVMGGDQVYPTASRDQYANRLAGPYEAALPWCDERPPHLYAIPGNHDWYDGLTAFLRLFCQRRWIGAWSTRQHRSYFALQLPQRWWLLGVDVQLESDIDEPQREYFGRVAQRMQAGDRVILCTAEPTWVHTTVDPNAFDNLAFFEKTVLAPRGAELALTLTGDLHHYSRYTDAVRPQAQKHHKITAGGGGAYLLGTQLLPEEIRLAAPAPPPGAARPPEGTEERYTREADYPSAARSIALKWGALSLAWKNPSFGVFLGALYALFAWFLQGSSKITMGLQNAGSDGRRYADFMDFARHQPASEWRDVLRAFWGATSHAPLVMAFCLMIVAGLIAFCSPDVERFRPLRDSPRLRGLVRCCVGLVHGCAHLALAIGLIWLFSGFNLETLGLPVDGARQVGLFVAEMAVVGGALGAVLMSLFLLPGVNYNEAFSAQHLEEYKNFVRLHIAPDDGTLTVYPYGVDRPGRWRFHGRAAPGEPYYVPSRPPELRLIESPIVLAGSQPPSHGL